MTDRELLELAAKAAGIDGRIKEWVNAGPDFIRPEGDVWNPLEDDGDALRLAVKLMIDIDHRQDQKGVFASRIDEQVDTRVWARWQECGGDKGAATRRAIVRAAAELGKAMP